MRSLSACLGEGGVSWVWKMGWVKEEGVAKLTMIEIEVEGVGDWVVVDEQGGN